MDMAMEATDTDMAMDTTAIMARGRPRLPLMPSLAMDIRVMAMDMDMAMEATDTDMAMDTTAIMARGRLRLPPLLSPAMDMVMDTAMVTVMVMDTAMEAMDMDTTATTARGLLMLLPAMDTMVMDMADMVDMATDTVTDMAMATTDKFLLFNAVESSVQKKEFGPFGTSLELQNPE